MVACEIQPISIVLLPQSHCLRICILALGVHEGSVWVKDLFGIQGLAFTARNAPNSVA